MADGALIDGAEKPDSDHSRFCHVEKIWTFFWRRIRRKGINKGFIVGAVVGVIVIAVGIWLLSFRPPVEDQMARVLADSYHEGSPEFQQLTKDIIISTDDRTVESPNALGSVSMFISGNVRNKGSRVFSALEINVAVVDSFNSVLKEKRVLLVPLQRERLGPDETVPITLTLEGFSQQDDRANIRWKVTAIKTEN